jgi:hypothetical protein
VELHSNLLEFIRSFGSKVSCGDTRYSKEWFWSSLLSEIWSSWPSYPTFPPTTDVLYDMVVPKFSASACINKNNGNKMTE